MQAEYLDYGDEELVTTVRNPYDLIATWYVRSKTDMPMRRWIRDYDKPPHIRDGRMYYHANPGVTLLKFEGLQTSFDRFCARFGLGPWKLPHHNQTPQKSPWDYYFDEESYVIIRHRFGPEIERIGYLVM